MKDIFPLLAATAFIAGCASSRYLTATAIAGPDPAEMSETQRKGSCRNAASAMAIADLRKQAGLPANYQLNGVEFIQTKFYDDGRCQVKLRVLKTRVRK